MSPGFRGKILLPSSKLKSSEGRYVMELIHFYKRYFYRQQRKNECCRFILDVYRENLLSSYSQEAVLFLICVKKSLFPSIADDEYVFLSGEISVPPSARDCIFYTPFTVWNMTVVEEQISIESTAFWNRTKINNVGDVDP